MSWGLLLFSTTNDGQCSFLGCLEAHHKANLLPNPQEKVLGFDQGVLGIARNISSLSPQTQPGLMRVFQNKTAS